VDFMNTTSRPWVLKRLFNDQYEYGHWRIEPYDTSSWVGYRMRDDVREIIAPTPAEVARQIAALESVSLEQPETPDLRGTTGT
jgi:hypothetical protein